MVYCAKKRGNRMPWRSTTKVPSSPHYITAKQNSYVTVPLKDVVSNLLYDIYEQLLLQQPKVTLRSLERDYLLGFVERYLCHSYTRDYKNEGSRSWPTVSF